MLPCSNSTFNTPHPTLDPIPVASLFYRWNVDLCGPFPTSKAGFKYVLVCIESLSKHVEAVPLKSKEAPEVAAAFPVSYTHLTLPTIYSV